MTHTTIGFIGGGNMARSIIGGLINSQFNKEQIFASDISPQILSSLENEFAITTSTNNSMILHHCDVIVLAVKPQMMKDVINNLPQDFIADKLFVSIAAGIREQDLNRWLGGNAAVVRTMPNTPSLVQTGATGMFANNLVSPNQKKIANDILSAIGITIWLENEDLMDSVTAVSGSGPAYFFLVMEAMEEAALSLGLNTESARKLVLQTALGAAKIAIESNESPQQLRKRVTSPNGTTEQGVAALEQGNLRNVFKNALNSAAERSKELGKILGDS